MARLTFDQIEEAREEARRLGRQLTPWDFEHTISLSLAQAARRVGLPFEQCGKCNGAGYTRATLLGSLKAHRVLAEHCPDEPVSDSIQYDKCPDCDGVGGWLR